MARFKKSIIWMALPFVVSMGLGCSRSESKRLPNEGNAYPPPVFQLSEWCKSDDITADAKKTLDAMIRSLSAESCTDFEYRYSRLERRRISVAFEKLSDPAPILALKDLQELSVRGNAFTSINWTRTLQNLTDLDAAGNPLASAENEVILTSSIAPNLAHLVLDDTGIKAIEFGTESKLVDISLGSNGVTNVDFLSGGGEGIKRLNLSGNPLGELHSLAKLSSLTELTLNDFAADVEPSLEWLPKKIEALHLAVSQQQSFGADLSKLDQFEKLRDLKISNRIISGEILANNSVVELDVEGCQFSDASVLGRFSKVQNLNVSGTQLAFLPDLAKLKDLTSVYADRSGLVSVDGAKLPVGLRAISIEDSHIFSLKNFDLLSNLVNLSLKNNGIEDLNSFSWPVKLQSLDLAQNSIVNLEPLQVLTALTTLRLGRNRIKNPEAVAVLVNLEWLDLSGNRIGTISSLAALTKLNMLDLRANGLAASTACPLENTAVCLF